ncbi:TPA: hypothetical protein GDO54_018520 [Pyxicephalus adspersus]|uniref:G-protein coupled receptors family 1 profile domain-containing protein n=1 Tax=Pyxicephalus adspersus TaxID=30357 RepID=A0AAV2ZGG7_PYXAD|nr:TPA: hypothetical protein GDO54_018520 [Pyxicephalus adspersus]
MGNQTFLPDFISLGLSDFKDICILISLLTLPIYVVTLARNRIIFILIASASHLQTPMYFFLGNFSVLDIVTSCISTSHCFSSIFPGKRLILYLSCIAQVFVFYWLATTMGLMLGLMSFKRYVAISYRLFYTTIISIQFCVQMALFSWAFNFVYSSFIALSITFLSYVYIFKTILRIRLKDGRVKAFSTCSSHLTVVFIFYGTAFFNYFHPNTEEFPVGRLVSAVYTLLTPFLNPLIYSLRNNELKGAVRRALPRLTCRP